MKRFTIFLTPLYAKTLVYMLQSTEYQTGPYLQWWWHTRDFSRVAYRRELELTRRANMLLLALQVGILMYVTVALWFVVTGWPVIGILLVLLYPVVWAHALVLPVWLGYILIVAPGEAKAIRESEKIFAKQASDSIIVAVAGSYGKTSMKELLATVLSTQLTVAATPANYNVAISHARFAKTLKGNEDVVIVEYGEGAPGDVAKFARTTHPSHAIITGLAPVHLDRYKTLEATAKDIFSLTKVVSKEHIFINTDSSYVMQYAEPGLQEYGHKSALGWKVIDIVSDIDGVRFRMQRGSVTMNLSSGLLGRHNIGPLSCVAALAYEFGLSAPKIIEAISQTRSHEHRMQPYQLEGAWIIDDTYNGNIEGIRAGTALLAELAAKRKIYVTPGLVDQGSETKVIHKEMGKLIAGANPNLVVLMENSVTSYITQGLTDAGFSGIVQIEDDPLDFYTHLSHLVAAGDVVMMQNDWTDNYH